ncbi:MAG: FAD-binding protein [Mycobacterium sp.]
MSKGAPAPVEAFKKHGADFVVADTLEELVEKMNDWTDEPLLDVAWIRSQIESRDLQMANLFLERCSGVRGIRIAPLFRGPDRPDCGRRTGFDPDAGPLIGVKLHVPTRKTLGGIQTDLSSRAIGADAQSHRRALCGRRSRGFPAVAACTGTTR